DLTREPIDTLILGCTHYPFLSDYIQQCMGPDVTLISSADQTAREISALLYHTNQLAPPGRLPLHRFFCSGDPDVFQRISQLWLGEHIEITPVVWQVPKLL
ncbi:hypothetical protein U6X42_12345, partial [Cutibacterium acnes]